MQDNQSWQVTWTTLSEWVSLGILTESQVDHITTLCPEIVDCLVMTDRDVKDYIEEWYHDRRNTEQPGVEVSPEHVATQVRRLTALYVETFDPESMDADIHDLWKATEAAVKRWLNETWS